MNKTHFSCLWASKNIEQKIRWKWATQFPLIFDAPQWSLMKKLYKNQIESYQVEEEKSLNDSYYLIYADAAWHIFLYSY